MTFRDGVDDLVGYINGRRRARVTYDKLYPSTSDLWYGIGTPDSQHMGDSTAFDGWMDGAEGVDRRSRAMATVTTRTSAAGFVIIDASFP